MYDNFLLEGDIYDKLLIICFFCSLNTAEILAELEELDRRGDIYLGLPDCDDNSDGDSDLSDEEAHASSVKLSKGLLAAPAELASNSESEDDEQPMPVKRSAKRIARRRWIKKPLKIEPINTPASTISEEAKACTDPFEYFELFFDDTILKIMEEQSNLYALQNNKSLNVSKEELKVVFAGMLLSSICPLPNRKKYWSTENTVPKILAKSMRRDRFLDIMHNIHFVDNTVNSSDRANKVRPLFEHMQQKFKKHCSVDENLSIDESMIPYYGKHYAKQFIRGKPIRFGFKMWALCSKGGYLHAFELYMGKRASNDGDPKLGLGGNVVHRLATTAEVPPSMGYKLFFDNYFTSVSLMERLTEMGILASGTCRDNRTERCPIATDKSLFKNESRGAFDYRSSDSTLIVKWKDNKDVILATNFDSTEQKSTQRWDKIEKKYIQVPQPICFQNYNKHMGYVDQMDQNVGTYRVRMRQRKWWWPIFSYFLSVVVNNACQLMRRNGGNMTNFQFIEHLVINYCKKYGVPSIQGVRNTSSLRDVARYDMVAHFVESIDRQRKCRLCKVVTKYQCDKCDVGLHPKCFKAYHTK